MTSLRHKPGSDGPRRGEPARRLPGCRPRVHPRRRLAAYHPHRGGPAGRRLADDDLPHLAGHAPAARRPDDPRVVGRRRDRGRRSGPRALRRGPAGRRHRRHGARAARQRAVRADHRARPRADPPLPAVPPRPLAGPDPRAHRGGDRRGSGRRRGAQGRPDRDGSRAGAHHPRLRDLGTHDGRRRASPRPSSTTSWPPSSPGCSRHDRDPDHSRARRRAHRRRRGRHRARRHRRRGRARRGHPGPLGARRRRPRPRVRHLALVVQARSRRAALPRLGPGRHRPRERRRARHPDGGHRAAPHPRDADPAAR